MDRRKILKTISGAIPVSPSLSGCTGDEGDGVEKGVDGTTDPRTTASEPPSTRTAVSTSVKGNVDGVPVYVYRVENDDDRRGAIEALLDRFETDFSGQRVAVKANFNSADPFPASTHPETLAALFDAVRDGADVVLAERSGMGDTRTVLEETGVLDLADAKGVDVVVLDDLESDRWRREDSSDSHWQDGFLFPDVFADADAVGVAVLRGYDTRTAVAEGPVFEQEQIARAAALGLGVTGPEDVRVVPVNEAAEDVAAAITERIQS
jgi:uncharacterized protein (DUF362 family)